MFKIQKQLENWWEHGEQKNPCIVARVLKEDHGPIPDTDDLEKFWTDADFRIDRNLKIIANSNYYGQAVPYHYLDFSAPTMVAVLGGKLDYVDKETTWAHPIFDSIEPVFEVVADKNYKPYKFIRDMTRKLAARCGKEQYIAPFALEGMTDILAGLYGVENFLMDMMLKPDEVKRAMEHFKRVWIDAFNDINGIIAESGAEGNIGWAGVWAPGTTFPIQEDVSYMISSDIFREFCIPHIRDIIDAMEYPFYHLDGVGAIGHLDSLLEIEPLKAIQWQPGAGKERLDQWYDLIKRILDHNKSVQVYACPNEVDDLVKNVGSKGLLIICEQITNNQADRLMEKYGDE